MATQQGLFTGLPIDTRSEEERLAEAARVRAARLIANTQSLAQGMRPSEQGAANIGGMLGALLGQRFTPAKLTQSQQAQADAVKAANTRFKQYISDNPDSDIEDQALEKQRLLAEELLRSGDFENGMQLAVRYKTVKEQRTRAEAELARINATTESEKAQQEASQADTQLKQFLLKKDKIFTIWPKGESPIDPQGQTATLADDGRTMITADGQQIPLGKYSIIAPPRSRSLMGANELGISDHEAGELRKQKASVMSQMRAAMAMRDALKDSIGADGSVNIMGATGSLSAKFTQVIDNLTAAGRAIDASITIGDKKTDLSNATSAQSYAHAHFEELDSGLGALVPANLRNDKRAREKYYSALVQFTYARSMAAEPGARNVSDADFLHHIIESGGATSDPESFRQVMLGNVSRDVDAFRDALLTLPLGAGEFVLSKEGKASLDKMYDEFKGSFGTDFGTAGKPGPGLTRSGSGEFDFDPATGQLVPRK